jgi:sugar/nucleoside kinase (ribokinase family)
MTVDVAVVGAPFLDLTFEGMARVPEAGEEVVARALHFAPGGTGMQAVAAARLGLSTALVAPVGHRGPARLVREMLEREGVRVVSRESDFAVPVTALLSTGRGVAMATALTADEPSLEDVASAQSRSVIASLGRLSLTPNRAAVYAVTGGLELDHVDDAILDRLTSTRALVINAGEAAALTGHADPGDAALALARRTTTVVVTMGADGALGAEGEQVVRAPAPRVDVADATGAGDLFVAAYVWADLQSLSLAGRLAWACLYAGLSVRAPTALAGAPKLSQLLAEGASRGLVAPRLDSG